MPPDTLQELHVPIDIRIVELLLSVIPESWYSIQLEIGPFPSNQWEKGAALSISNPDGEADIVMPPDELYEKVIEHARLFRAHGRPWKALTYRVSFDEIEEDWRYTIDFEY